MEVGDVLESNAERSSSSRVVMHISQCLRRWQAMGMQESSNRAGDDFHQA